MTDFSGQDFDRYHILESLGEGGMASVYKAFDTRLERDVAVKIIRTDMFIPATLQHVLKRFEREAKLLAKLSHPNIVSIIDYGEHAGVPYLVMEYLPGGTLKDRLKGHPLPWQESIHLLLPIARSLQFSHQQGIIHRDVKPSNILITLSGEPMLSDFGIAKILESEGNTALTGTGVGIGTPEFMAPEQWVGKTSPQSDLYSLGVVLYEMVTGRKPYTAETPAAILLKQANEPLPRPRHFVPDLPERVEKIILKALAKKPENRYSDMEDFINPLENLLLGQTRIKHPVIPAEKHKAEISPEPEEVLPLEEKQIEAQPTVVPAAKQKAKPSPEPVDEFPFRQGNIGDQPTLDVRLPAIEVPAEPVIQPLKSVKTGIPFPGLQSIKALWHGKIKVRPAWIIAIVGLVAVLVLAVWGIPALLARYSHNPALTVTALQSPMSGSYVFFTSDQSGKREIFYLDSKGIPIQYTHTKGDYQSWSPVYGPGGLVFFTSDQNGKTEVYYMNSKGIPVQYTHTQGNYQSWSPTYGPGGLVFFTSDQNGKTEVYYMNLKGIPVQYTHTQGNYQSWSPVYGPGGLVFFTSDQAGKREIYYMDSNGIPVQYTHTQENFESWSPVYSPGGLVFFTSDQSGKSEVYYMNSKGIPVQYTHTQGNYQSWSPAYGPGGLVFFTSDQSGKAEIYYMNSNGIPIQYTQTQGNYQSWFVLSPKPSSS
jgi:serine/threonine protein kinase/Tol biopolymer transport system component